MLNQSRSAENNNWALKLVIINAGIFLLQLMLKESVIYLEYTQNDHLYRIERSIIDYYFAMTPYLVISKKYIWQLGTYMFLHSTGSFLHIIINMYLLFMLGQTLEQLWGSKRFLFFFFMAGISGGILNFVVSYFLQDVSILAPTVGASGAIMGLVVAFGIIFPNVQFLFLFFIPMKAKHLVIFLGTLDLFLFIFFRHMTGISHMTHLGGLLFGIIYFGYYRRKGLIFKGKMFKAKVKKEEHTVDKPNPFTQGSSKHSSLEEILKKIKANGPEALTDDEYQHVKYMNTMHENEEGLCVEDDFDINDSYCDKCENVNACLMREIKKYL